MRRALCAQSKSQKSEGMKKMMKKFLSSLLALTMILSLVIVPANATGGADGTTAPTGSATLSITDATGKGGHAKVGDTLTFALTNPVVNDGSGTPSNESIQNITWQVNGDSNNGSYKVTTADAGKTLTVSYTAEIEYLLADQCKTGSVIINDTTKVHVDAEETYTYTVNGEVSVSAKPDTGIKSGDTVKFTVNTDKLFYKKISSNNPDHGDDLTEGTDYTLSYAWTVNGKSDPNKTASIDVKLTTDKASAEQTVSCKVSATFKDDPTYKSNSLSGSKTVTVTNDKVNADAEFAAAIKQVTFNNRTYGISGPVYYLANEHNNLGKMTAVAPKGFTVTKTEYDESTKKLTVTGKKTEGNIDVTAEFKLSCTQVDPTVTINKPSGLTGSTVYVGSSYTFTPSFAESLYGSTSGVKYEWTVKGTDVKTSNSGNNYTVTPGKAGKITITLTATDRGNEEYKATLELTVEANPYTAVATGKTEFTINTNETLNLATSSAPALYKDYGTSNQEKIAKNVTGPKWESNDKTVATVTSNGVVKGLKSGTATITATLTYEGKDYPVEYKVRVSALDCKLESVENGATVGYTRNDLMSAAEEAIYAFDRTRVDVTDVTVVLPSGTSYGTFYDDEDCGRNDKVTGSYSMDSGDELYFKSENGYVGSDVKVTLNVKTRSDGNYSVTAVIPVTMRKGEFESQVTGSDKTYKVTVPSGYEAYWVLSTSKEPAASEYDGSWATKTAGKYTSKSLYSFSTSNLKDGEGKLYIVAIDDKDNAYSGVIELKANAYTIKYTVTAGDSVDFKQEHFEDLLDTMFKDQNEYNSKNYTASFSHINFKSVSSGSSTSGWQLYDGKNKLQSKTDVKDASDISLSTGSKVSGTIKIPFTIYADITKDSTGKTAKSNMPFNATVEITVVKEDIVFEVGVNSAVKLGSDKFIDFLRDSDKSYRKADLDYVTFDVGKNSAITSYFNGTGALYRYYNGSTGINATVSAKDEFYYNPKTSSKHYDLDDVTYVTSKFAKVGDIVYIPFTAYGTKSGQKAEGTLAIKVKQTMNFVDVHTYDYFYDSVQWAVNLDITKGTSATTFSPKQGCTRAQIVTFLWRAANSPAPRSSTNKFTDVYATTHADYMKAIIWATEQGITTGTGNGKFSPDDTCTRAQIVTFLYRFKGNPAVYGSLNFSDVNKTEHAAFYNAILWAVNNKITTGYGNGIFDPNGTCNRGDAVTFLYRALA